VDEEWKADFSDTAACLINSNDEAVAELKDAWKDTERDLGILHHLRFRAEVPVVYLAMLVGLRMNRTG
jgi:hypothetical protein